jgi:hypothetical protein
MKSKEHLYIYTQQVFGKGQIKIFYILINVYCSIQEKDYMFLGRSLSSDSTRLEKS